MTKDGHDGDAADFGFKTVDVGDKQGLVNEVFSRVAGRYDLMNDLMSGGLHRLWKDDLINWLSPPRRPEHYQHLDVAGGTGDVAMRVVKATGGRAEAIVCDISGEMLRAGREKRAKSAEASRIQLVVGNAEALPFPAKSFDAATIAFGIRNVPRRDLALAEAFRVLKPGGRFLCLEFSEVVIPLLDKVYDRFSFDIIPWLGDLVAGDRASYEYLVESIRRFPKQEAFAGQLRDAGFGRVAYRNLTGGIAAIHSGWRL